MSGFSTSRSVFAATNFVSKVRQWTHAAVLARVVNPLLYNQRDKKAEFGDLCSNRLDVHTIDAVLYEIEFPAVVECVTFKCLVDALNFAF